MTHSQKEQIIRNYIRAYNSKDVTAMLHDLADELVFENSSNGEITMRLEGLEAFRQQAEQATALFAEREQSITGLTHINDEQTEISISYKATLATDLPNGMKAGDVLELSGKSVFTFSGNTIMKLEDLA